MDTDRNFLFGVLALQLEYIDAKRFREASAAWAVTKQQPMSEILIERGWINTKESVEVERFLDRKVKKNAGSVEQTLASELPPEARDVVQAFRHAEPVDAKIKVLSPMQDHDPKSPEDPTSDQEVAHPDAVTLDFAPFDSESGGVETSNYEPEAISKRYTLTKMHGEGGIGRVWLAHDRHLSRDVALKEIRPDKKQSEVSCRRFVKEAQITSQLEHPNIVPVYELSNRDSEGRSFYTMRFVRGNTLRKAIDIYHRKLRKDTATPIDLRELLNSFVLVCHAIEYSHWRRVLHRDLKPSNVMIGPFGEVVVLDWGLAKMVDHDDDDDDDDLLAALPISVTADADIQPTQQGAVLGTLPYMAPEQAAGRID